MSAILSPRAGILLLLAIATTFGANHVAARVAFEHGASVTAAVAMRSGCTALAVLALLRISGVALSLPRPTLWRALVVGALIAVQSFCLYSAVARIPVALALLAFNLFPILLSLLTWALDGVRPAPRAAFAMPLALFGLALALDVFGKGVGVAGLTWAIGAAVSFAGVLYLIGRWLKEMDGRLRSFYTMGVTAVLVSAAGLATDGFAFPVDTTGWAGLALLTVLYGTAITALFIVLPRVGAASNAVVLNFEPIAVLGIAWVVLGQTVAPLQVLGAFLVVGAIASLALRR